MATTKVLEGAPTGTVNVNLPVLAFANFELIGDVKEANENTHEYVLASGDESYPVTLRVSVYNKPSANNGYGTRTVTIRVDFYAIETDDTSGEVLVSLPGSMSFTSSIPGTSPTFSADDYLTYALALVSVLFQTVDGSYDPVSTVVDKLKYGVSDIL